MAAREVVARRAGRDARRPGHLPHGKPGPLPGARQLPAEVGLGGDTPGIRLLGTGAQDPDARIRMLRIRMLRIWLVGVWLIIVRTGHEQPEVPVPPQSGAARRTGQPPLFPPRCPRHPPPDRRPRAGRLLPAPVCMTPGRCGELTPAAEFVRSACNDRGCPTLSEGFCPTAHRRRRPRKLAGGPAPAPACGRPQVRATERPHAWRGRGDPHPGPVRRAVGGREPPDGTGMARPARRSAFRGGPVAAVRPRPAAGPRAGCPP